MFSFGKRKQNIRVDCDFRLAREELADFFRITNEEAVRQGTKFVFRQEFVEGWRRFSCDPCMQTATAWLSAAPNYQSLLINYFTKCSPGGEFYTYRTRQKAATNAIENLPIKEQVKEFREVIDSVVEEYTPKARPSEAFKLVIITAAHQCFKKAEQFIKADDEKDRLNKRFLINCEYFYFFMHLANRRFYTDHGEPIGRRWQNDLGPKYVVAFLESVIGHWPQEMKDRIRSELYEKINDAELDYTPCRGLYPEDNKVFTGNTLFAKLARNVAELAGTTNPIHQFLIMDGAFQVFLRLGFQDRINELARELR